MQRAQHLIDLLDLEAHPEGGYFKETYRSPLILESPAVHEKRNAMTDIYFMLKQGQVSRFHKVRHDEVWHFYDGSPLRLYDYEPEHKKLRIITLGAIPDCDCYKYVIPADHWQAAVSLGEFSLLGCTVAPGFDFSDFRFLDANASVRADVLENYPELSPFV